MKRLLLFLTLLALLLPGARANAAVCQHNVARGDTLSGIAEQYGTTVAAIRASNPNTGLDPLLVGQTISVPCVQSSQKKAAPATQPRGGWHLVRVGTARCVSARQIGGRVVYAPRGWCYLWSEGG